jgi:hypothetical protein
MLNQNLWRFGNTKTIRLLQLLFLSMALWFIYWAHIYEVTYWNKTLLESCQSNYPNVLAYSISIITIIYLEFRARAKRPRQIATSSPSHENIKELQKENKQMKQELQKAKKSASAQKIPSNKISIALLTIGALLLLASVIVSSTILAFIGLGLAFWGALFLFATSTKFVKAPILDAAAISYYTTLDRIIDDLNYKGKPIYIPPYPKDTYLPEHLAGLKEMVVSISAENNTEIPNIGEIAQKEFLVKNPQGIVITPPGSGLVNLFEKELSSDLGSLLPKELGADFTKMDQESFYEWLPTIIVNHLELASNLEIKAEKNQIYLKITDSVYRNLYSWEKNIKTIHSIGCPLISAIACALAIKTGKLVTITETKISPDLKTIEVWYGIVEG